MPDGTPRFKVDGKDCYHFMGTSCFSQYTVLPEVSVAKIDEKAPLEKVCLLGCGITTGYGAITRTLKAQAGDTVVVVGLGGVGLAAVMGAKMIGASKIIGIDINPAKFDIAKEMGCTDCINSLDLKGKKVEDVVFELTDGEGADFAVECVGLPLTMRQALLCTRPDGGSSCIIGVAAAGVCIELSAEELMGRSWTGSAFGGQKSREDVPRCVDMYMKGEMKVDEYITHHFGLADINKAFEVMREGSCIRAIVDLFA
jgi:S-(hydroxymethyl)glutathione dehydrogenase/alcohol dehydrogenase